MRSQEPSNAGSGPKSDVSTNKVGASGTGRFIAKSAANRQAAAQVYVKASLPFASIELLGFLVIASCGMFPAVRSITAVLRRPPSGAVLATILRTYLTTTRRLLVPLFVGGGLLVLASVLEILWGVTYS